MNYNQIKPKLRLSLLLSVLGILNFLEAIEIINPKKDFLIFEFIIFSLSFIYFLYININSYLEEQKHKQRFDDKYNAINNSNIVVVFDKNGKIIEVNDKFCEALMYKKEDVIGMTHREFIVRAEDISNYDLFWNDLNNGEYIEGEFERARSDGSSVWISASYSPVRCKKGIVYQVIKIGQDITVDFKNRSEIMQTNVYLEHAGKILRHDMHSGINTYIPRAVKSLERRLDNETIEKLKLKSTLKLLKDGLRHTQKVYEGVKEFTNLVKKDTKIDVENHNLKDILTEYLSLTAYKDQVIIKDLAYANVNEPLFCTAVDNFIRNGLKYNDSPTKWVEIFMVEEGVVGIKDNGRGMSSEEFKKYCLPYQRGVNEESGSGLGLNISVAILSEHEFEVECEKLELGTLIKVKIK